MQADLTQRVYRNRGNPGVVSLVDASSRTVLDLGCGAGDNAARLRERDPHKRIFGVTASQAEAQSCADYMEKCWVADLEEELPSELREHTFDVVVLSHVLEHLRDPALLVARATRLLRPGGSCVIAVPNVMNWSQRLKFLAGRFEYQETGVMDSTHLRFYSYDTAARYLLAQAPELRLVHQQVTGSVPLWILRRGILPARLCNAVDEAGCRYRPNLFGSEVLLKAVKDAKPAATVRGS